MTAPADLAEYIKRTALLGGCSTRGRKQIEVAVDQLVARHVAFVDRVAADLLETDALTPNHDGTPEHYTVAAEDVPYLVETVLNFAKDADA